MVKWLLGVLVVAGAVAAFVLTRGGDPAPPAPPKPAAKAVKAPLSQRFRSRPDLHPPVLTASGHADADVLIAPKRSSDQSGPAILDPDGGLLWFHPAPTGETANDFRVQRYQGKPVLTWWEGKMKGNAGYGSGTWVIADQSYREITRLKAGNGLQGDLHEMQLTSRGTALIGIYHAVSFEGRQVLDCIIQEVDVATGKVLWDWHSLDHVGIGESHVDVPKDPKTPMDYFHINSIDQEPDGNLLVSARNTWALYEIDKKTGEILWRLGGRRSDFALGDGVRFAWQHDARRQQDGTITIFDNEATPKVRDLSRALVLKVDERARTVSIAHAFTHPAKLLSFAEGNTQLLGDGGVFVGWGLGRRASELGPDGSLRFDVRLPADTDSYRATTVDWHGTPSDPPALYPTRASSIVTAYASWNGATDVTAWQLVGGTSASDLHPVGAVESRTGFETELETQSDAPLIAVRALSGTRVLGTSVPLAPSG